MRRSTALLLPCVLVLVAGCTTITGEDAEGSTVGLAPSTAATPSERVVAVPMPDRQGWSVAMNAACRQQAALTPSMATPMDADPDTVELGARSFAEAARRVDQPPADTEVSAAYLQLDKAAQSWLRLATAVTATRSERQIAARELQMGVQALVEAGAADCGRLAPSADE